MIIRAIKTHIFQEGDGLFAFLVKYFKKLSEKSVVVITSKIVALAEKRTAVIKNSQTKEKLIIRESEFAMPTKYVWLTVKNGVVMASAGIDESNSNGKLILLPNDSFKTAHILRKKLQKKYSVKNLGVLITDSHTMPFRAGTIGIAIGYAGFSGIKDYRGTPDIFGRKFGFSRMDVADSLATAAVSVMGEGNEQQPLAIIEKAPIKFCDKINRNELYIDIQEDMYRPLFLKLSKYKKKPVRRPAKKKKFR